MGAEGSVTIQGVLEAVLRLGLVVVAFLLMPLLVGQMEHKAMAHMQARLGPMYAGGFHGWAQLVADGVKFVQKGEVVPAAADRAVYQLAPAVSLLPYLLVLVVIPVGPGKAASTLDLGLFFALAVTGIDRKSTRLNSSHPSISYAVFCLKKKT